MNREKKIKKQCYKVIQHTGNSEIANFAKDILELLESELEPTEYLHIGWYSPDEKRFCYCDEKEAYPDRRNHYTIKVYASNQIDRLTAVIEQLKEYIQHKPDCDFINWQGDNPKRKCTCGLEQTLKGGEL